MASPLREYLERIAENLRSGNATEESHRPALAELIERLGVNLHALNEPKRIACGAPDIAVQRNTDGYPRTLGYIETKEIDTPLAQAEKSDQLRRYLSALPNLILTDYLEFWWYTNGTRRMTARLATRDHTGKLKPEPEGEHQLLQLLNGFLNHTPEPIADPLELAKRLAHYAHLIRNVLIETFQKNQQSELLQDLRKTFADTLLPDLDKPERTAEFADMLAQTLAYGLFAARCSHSDATEFRRIGSAQDIPKTSPFLRQLFETLTGTGLSGEPFMAFVDDLANLLACADMHAILHDFGKRTGREDPVIHFYETFLHAYDPKLRELRGVYYTPEAVVSYLVRSVHALLKRDFGFPDGLATLPTHPETTPPLYLLDPACGTGTFLASTLDLIRNELERTGRGGYWNPQLIDHLLKRIFGFELLMAPYVIAHLKLGLQLATAGTLPNRRLGVYLTNTLDEPSEQIVMQIGPWRIISEEAHSANQIKQKTPILVIMGNPPYSANSANKIEWITQLVRERYYPKDTLKEQNPKLLLDDYVKFIRWAQWRIEKTGQGILAFITNHGYLENPTFRGMRKALMEAFDALYLLDLHGNALKQERAPDGSADENVFDIRVGVALLIAVKLPRPPEASDQPKPLAVVYHADLYGNRADKYQFLSDHDVLDTEWRLLEPQPPFYLFAPQDTRLLAEYEQGWKITEIFSLYSTGIKTHRDQFVFDFERAPLEARIREFRDLTLPDDTIRKRYDLRDTRDWKMSEHRKALASDPNWQSYFQKCLYRPFDVREIYYTPHVVELDRREVMKHLLHGANLALITCRQQSQRDREWSLVGASKSLVECCAISNKGGEINYVFPLYLYTSNKEHAMGVAPQPNLNPAFLRALADALRADGSTPSPPLPTPEQVFYYLYAVLHSPTYRARYAEFLKRDFPRIPLPRSLQVFQQLSALGEEFVQLHLLESPRLLQSPVGYPIRGSDRVEKGYPKYVAPVSGVHSGRVFINPSQYFESVAPEVWSMKVGGYQVASKWLKDRVGRTLTLDEIETYRKILYALHETQRLMAQVDTVLNLSDA